MERDEFVMKVCRGWSKEVANRSSFPFIHPAKRDLDAVFAPLGLQHPGISKHREIRCSSVWGAPESWFLWRA